MSSLRTTSRIAVASLATLALTLTTACNRDPNVRKQKYLESGKRYEDSGKYKEAVIQFSNALKVDKNYAAAHFELGKTYLKLKNGNLAYSELLRTIQLNPSNQEARITVANLLLAGGAPPERAEEQAKAVLAVNPQNADAYAVLAGVAQAKGDKAGATKNIEQALAIDPNRSGFHSALALLHASNADASGAEQELRKAAELDPKNASSRVLLGELLTQRGDTPEAEQQFQSAIAAAPDNMQARGALAALYMRKGDNQKAEQVLLDGVNANPDLETAPATLLEFYGKTNQMDRARSTFASLSSKFPKSIPIKSIYASVLLDKRDFTAASPVIAELVKADAGNPQVQTLNAMLLVNTGKTDEAMTQLKKAVRDNPNSLQAQILLGRVAMTKGDITTAQTSFAQAIKISPGNTQAEDGLAEVAMRRDDAGLLSSAADQMIQAHPQVAQGYLWRGMAESSNKLYEKAAADLQTALQKAPNNPAVYLSMGQLQLVQGHTAQAQSLLQKSLDLDPSSYRALQLLVFTDLQAKQPAKAISRVQNQIAKQPQSGIFYAELADLQLRTNDLQGAKTSAQKALQLAPNSPEVTSVYTRAEVALGNIDPAIDVWQKWTAAHPADSRGPQIVGTLQEAKGDTAKAEESYKKALELNSSDAIAANNLAYLMVEGGQNPEVALSLAQTARRVMPDSAQTADTLAWVYYAKGNYSSARDLLESALKTTPDDASLQYHLGMTYMKLNDKANAQAHLKRAQTLSPNSKFGKDAGAQLQKL